MKCVPLCTMCHLTNPGQSNNWNSKPLGLALFAPIHSESDITPAWNHYAQDPANAAAVASIKDGKEPKSGQDVCGPTYGCGVHVEKGTPWRRDYAAPPIALGALGLGALARRRTRA